jgi:hypothetical protein
MPELAGEIEKACGARANPPHSRALANVLKKVRDLDEFRASKRCRYRLICDGHHAQPKKTL